MLRSNVFSCLLLASSLVAASGQNNQTTLQAAGRPDGIKLTVEGIRNQQGQIRVLLWSSADGFPQHPERAERILWIRASEAKQGSLVVNLSGLKPGYYAVGIAHDENDNGKIETNFLGFPTEGWAISNHAESYFHAPYFDKAKFQVNEAAQPLTLKLHY